MKRYGIALLVWCLLLTGCTAGGIVDSSHKSDPIRIVGTAQTPAPAQTVNDSAWIVTEAPTDSLIPTETPVVTDTPAPTATPTPEPIVAHTAEPTATPEPTEEPEPSLCATFSPAPDANLSAAERFAEIALSLEGESYSRSGASKETGFSPGGFVYYCLTEAGVKTAKRTSKGYSSVEEWTKIGKIADLEPGDLCFFITPGNESVNCVCIYIGDNQMIYPSSSKGVVMTAKITSSYWKEAFVFGRRVF